MEPRGLVIRWRDVKIHEGPGVVPHTVTVGGHDSESVITGPEAAKESFPTRSRVFPVLVDALQLVTKTRPFGDREAQCGVVDLHILGVYRKNQTAGRRVCLSVRRDRRDYDQGWQAVPIVFERCWVQQTMPLVVANHNRPPGASTSDGSGSTSPESPGRPSSSLKASPETVEPGSRSQFFNSEAETWAMPENPFTHRSPVKCSTIPDTLPGKSGSFHRIK